MRLLYITNQICGAAGLERVLSIKTNYLIEKYNYEIHMITLNQGDAPLFYEFNNKIQYHDIIAVGNFISYMTAYKQNLKKIVKKIQPDIISVCDDGLKGFLVPFTIKKPCPMVYERHASKNIELKQDEISFKTKAIIALKYKLMHWGAKRYDRFVVLTESNLEEWDLPNLEVIPNPLSFYPDEKAKSENKIVLAVGTQNYQKGYDRLLESWKIISKKYPDWTLKIYGKIDKSLQLESLANTLDIVDTTEFHSPVKDIVKQYLNASIYVMSSRSEGFGMVLIEAMACGVPTIAFDCPSGPKNIINDGVDGFLVPNNNVKAFSEAMIKLIEDKELRKKMGKNAKQNMNRFFPDEIIPQWHTLITGLTKHKH